MKNELLAPAGDLEAVKIAIDAGADAVYCAGKRFGARAFILNLSNEEIIEAAHYCHLHDKKIYITLNTLIFEDEIEEMKEYVDFLYQYVDAILVQDEGVFHYIRSTYPDFPVHLSTQMSIHNVEDIKKYKELGASRIVLARETSLKDIRLFKKQGVELEIFIHGALCFSYSGMCYLSYYKGGRSGNRGNCAQPCRQDYILLEDGEPIKEGPLLSMKDLNTIKRFNEILDLGVASLKIEGRAKSKEYLYSVVRIYRQLIDQYNERQKLKVSDEMLDDLYSSFSRETTFGYLFESNNKDVTTDYSVKHQGILIGKVLEVKPKQVKVKLYKELELLDGIRIIDDHHETGLTVTRIIEDGRLVKSSSSIIYLDVKDKVSVGAKVYKTQSQKVKKALNSQVFSKKLPVSLEISVKQKHQEIIATYNNIRVKKVFYNELEKAISVKEEKIKEQFSKTNNLPIQYESIIYTNEDNLYLPIPMINEMRQSVLSELKEQLENQKERRRNIPYILKDGLFVDKKSTDSLVVEETDNSLINYSSIKKESFAYHISEIDESSMISPYLGVTNHLAVSFYRNFTKGIIILSYECTYENAQEIYKYDKNIGYLKEFKQPLMVSKHCVVSKAKGFETKGCQMCKYHHYQLEDKSKKYNLKFRNCVMYIEGEQIIRPPIDDLINIILK